ncbi:CPBP family intramembrane glutamic endopeptidase [Sphingomicrobium clamense]|uniref:CPBP family intramembrane metalloprotease n=1 Tax=Sphingomicrobium clamense TaxID=2851013 RepID=A0ABS6V5A7_9SPHN|nr:CPBP family intramembrane glutamic endopeptidase [Sphingomicrobium sp. B8]MBW0144723.1 CPBP family intramembrane metalloprotease [Sphingomicrobium sp. B8]
MRQFFRKRSAATAIGIALLYFAILAAPLLFQSGAFGNKPGKSPQQLPLGQLPFEVGLAASVLALVFLLGWAREARVTSRPIWSGLRWALVPAIITGGLLAIGFAVAIENDVSFGVLWESGIPQNALLLVIFVGIFEETLFRGIALRGLEIKWGPVIALLVSSFLFGIMHYVNFIGGQTLAGTHQQVIHAGLAGILYGAIALRTRSIWPGVFLHALWDFTVASNAVLLGVNTGLPDEASGPSPVLSFAVHYFEPIIGILILISFLRWSKRQARITPTPA